MSEIDGYTKLGDFPFSREKNLFFNIIKHLDYIDIVKFCNITSEFINFCDNKDVWLYLLHRDFSPLKDTDILALKNKQISPKILYYKIQITDVKKALKYYDMYEGNALIMLIKNNIEYYYGIQWLIKRYSIYSIHEGLIDPTIKDNKALRIAVNNNYIYTIQYLLSLPEKYNINPSIKNNIIVKNASMYNYVELLQFLLSLPAKYNIDPTVDGHLAIKSANRRNYNDIVKILKKWYFDNNIKIPKL